MSDGTSWRTRVTDWCDHIKFYEGVSGAPAGCSTYNLSTYKNKWMITTINKKRIMVQNYWVYCPICGIKRPTPSCCSACGRPYTEGKK